MEMTICELYDDIMQKQMGQEFTLIMASENNYSFFLTNFFNMDISIDISHITFKFQLCIHESLMEESVFQNVDEGPTFYFMQCRNSYYKKVKKVTRFLTINEK